MSFSLGFPGLLERSESNDMPPFQQSLSDKANYQEFEGEISDVLNSALIEHDLPLARAWVPCVQNPKCCYGLLGLHRNAVFVLDVKCGNSTNILLYKDLFYPSVHRKKSKGIVGKAFMTNQAFFSPNSADTSNPSHISRLFKFQDGAIAVPLRSSIHNSECVFEFFFPFVCTHYEERKKIATALFSTLKQCCRTLRVVADKVLEEPSNSTFLAFPSLQPFDTVEQSVAKDSLIQKENPREADPKRVMQQLPESSDQNERCPDPTPRIEPTKTCDAIGLGSLAASETSEERHATGEKTVNVPSISLNDSAKSTAGLLEYLNALRDGMHRIQPRLSDKDNYQDFEAYLNPRSSSLLLDVPALQHFDTVEPSVACDWSFPKENPREADPKHVMQLLPESSDQNEKCPDPRPRLEPAEMFDAISLGSLAASETREERHATGEKTVSVPNISLNDSAKSTGVAGRSTGGAGSKRDWAWKYCSSIPGNSNGVICSFCDLEIKGGGITRFKSHISGSDPSKNVQKCENVPPEVKVEIDQKGKKRR